MPGFVDMRPAGLCPILANFAPCTSDSGRSSPFNQPGVTEDNTAQFTRNDLVLYGGTGTVRMSQHKKTHACRDLSTPAESAHSNTLEIRPDRPPKQA
jgi:hypothetical protein